MLFCFFPYRLIGNRVGKVVTIPRQPINNSRRGNTLTASMNGSGNKSGLLKKLGMKSKAGWVNTGYLAYRNVCGLNGQHD